MGLSTSMDNYEPTSERISEADSRSSSGRYLTYLLNLATYDYAQRYATGARVLDMGCGTGYGTQALAKSAASVVGVDIAAEAIAYAQRHYQGPNLSFRRIAPIEEAPLPFDERSFEVVTSFQVIEHVPDVPAYLAEIKRVLAPGGVFVAATPDRRTRLFPRQRPWNLYHLNEFAPEELRRVLEVEFGGVEVATISAPREMLEPELRRTRRLRLLTYPFTFPGAPEPWRRFGLRLLMGAQAMLGGGPNTGQSLEFDYGQRVITITPDADPSLDVVTVARRRA